MNLEGADEKAADCGADLELRTERACEYANATLSAMGFRGYEVYAAYELEAIIQTIELLLPDLQRHLSYMKELEAEEISNGES